MKYKVKYTKTVVLSSEFEVEITDNELAEYPGADTEDWAKEIAYEMDAEGKIDWKEVENQGDPPEVTKI